MSKSLGAVLVLCVPLVQGCGSINIDNPTGNMQVVGYVYELLNVPVQIEITQSVYNRNFVVTGGPNPITLTGFITSIKPGTQNTEILTANLQLLEGSYKLTASGTYNGWNGQATSIADTSSFAVNHVDPPFVGTGSSGGATGGTGGGGTTTGPCPGGAQEQMYIFCFRKANVSPYSAGTKACSASEALNLLAGQFSGYSNSPGMCP